MKRPIAFAVLCTLLLSGCTQQTGAADLAAEEAGRVNAQMQALEQAEQAGLLEDEPFQLSSEEALERVAGTIDAQAYTV